MTHDDTVTTLEEIQDRLVDAVEEDFEQGVPWLAEKQVEEFAKNFPALMDFLEWIGDLEEVTNDDAHEFYESRGDIAPESI